MSQSWRNKALQALPLYRAPIHPEIQHGEILRNDEEAHELLFSPDRTDFEEETDEQQPQDVKEQPVSEWSSKASVAADKSKFAARRASLLAAVILSIFLIAGLFIISSVSIRNDRAKEADLTDANSSTSTPLIITDPKMVRQEWRALSLEDKDGYITALRCLRSLPPQLSHMPPNASSYSDFPYIHAHIGYRTHNSASFLPWHRYFLHLYEQRLRSECGYAGGIPYWDWTKDADDLAKSPVFDAQSGFGGNGDMDGELIVGQHGRCVMDGPFAGLEVLWYDVKYRPHCLSRGFRTDEDGIVGKMDGSALRPAEIEAILELDEYEAFVTMLEKKVHDVIPFGVGGDFETFSAPFEPLFWLHHSQLDRIWWLWQQEKERRTAEYRGHKFRHSIEMASLDDDIEMGGTIGPNVVVRDVMRTNGGCNSGDSQVLCYQYA